MLSWSSHLLLFLLCWPWYLTCLHVAEFYFKDTSNAGSGRQLQNASRRSTRTAQLIHARLSPSHQSKDGPMQTDRGAYNGIGGVELRTALDEALSIGSVLQRSIQLHYGTSWTKRSSPATASPIMAEKSTWSSWPRDSSSHATAVLIDSPFKLTAHLVSEHCT